MHLMNEKLLREVRRLNSFIKLNGGIGVALPISWRGVGIAWAAGTDLQLYYDPTGKSYIYREFVRS